MIMMIKQVKTIIIIKILLTFSGILGRGGGLLKVKV
jgi:hypothetical protein